MTFLKKILAAGIVAALAATPARAGFFTDAKGKILAAEDSACQDLRAWGAEAELDRCGLCVRESSGGAGGDPAAEEPGADLRTIAGDQSRCDALGAKLARLQNKELLTAKLELDRAASADFMDGVSEPGEKYDLAFELEKTAGLMLPPSAENRKNLSNRVFPDPASLGLEDSFHCSEGEIFCFEMKFVKDRKTRRRDTDAQVLAHLDFIRSMLEEADHSSHELHRATGMVGDSPTAVPENRFHIGEAFSFLVDWIPGVGSDAGDGEPSGGLVVEWQAVGAQDREGWLSIGQVLQKMSDSYDSLATAVGKVGRSLEVDKFFDGDQATTAAVTVTEEADGGVLAGAGETEAPVVGTAETEAPVVGEDPADAEPSVWEKIGLIGDDVVSFFEETTADVKDFFQTSEVPTREPETTSPVPDSALREKIRRATEPRIPPRTLGWPVVARLIPGGSVVRAVWAAAAGGTAPDSLGAPVTTRIDEISTLADAEAAAAEMTESQLRAQKDAFLAESATAAPAALTRKISALTEALGAALTSIAGVTGTLTKLVESREIGVEYPGL